MHHSPHVPVIDIDVFTPDKSLATEKIKPLLRNEIKLAYWVHHTKFHWQTMTIIATINVVE